MPCFGLAVGQWQPALDAFEAMAPCGVKPDAVTYGALIAASDRGNQWCRALQARSLYNLTPPFVSRLLGFRFP